MSGCGWNDWPELSDEEKVQRVSDAEAAGERPTCDEWGSPLREPCPFCGNAQGPVIGQCGCHLP